MARHIMDNLDTSTSDQYITGQLDANYFRGTDSLKYPLLVDQGCFLPDHCLPKVDRCSMHYGLEVRVPFLDQELFKFTKQLASHDLINNYQRKFLLKKTFKHQLDGIELDRKKGFSSPLSEWWEMGLKRIAEYSFANSGFFQSSEMLKNLVKISKSNKDTMSLITLFSLALWADCWLEDQKLSSHDLLMSL
jgi:asparagine synthetase B (glutamine-hydrolysing)